MPDKEYDIALSFAGEDREYVEAVANALLKLNLTVFYDKFEEADLLGRNLVDHLSDVYQHRAKLCVLFASAAYAKKLYTRLERQSAQAKALFGDKPYIIPVRLDDAEIPGLAPTVAYASKKTPEALALLLASKLLLSEPEGIRTPGVQNKGAAVIVRFVSLLEPDMETFRKTLETFKHWSPTKLGAIPIELRIPEPFIQQVEAAKAFRKTDNWLADDVSEAARRDFSKQYDELVPRFHEETIKGTTRLIAIYHPLGQERLEEVIRRYLMSRNTLFARMLLGMRIVRMEPVAWEHVFAHFMHTWSTRIMDGLAYVCFLEGDERFLWVDVDGRDNSPAISWPQGRFRLFAPATFLVSLERDMSVTKEQFDRFFALQFLEHQMADPRGLPLAYFAEYPDRLDLSVRGEWAIEAQHFGNHSTSYSRGEPLHKSIKGLYDHLVDGLDLGDDSTDARREKEIRARFGIQRLFRDGTQFDHILR
jgi:hypothetical protein